MDNSEIIRYKDNLLTNLKLHGEYDTANGLQNKVLLVEGATDQAFINQIKTQDMRCISVVEFMKTRSAFSTSSSSIPTRYNSKEVIITILQRISQFPEVFDFPKGAETWPLYGLVDNDFDTASSFTRVFKLFFTDTHDIETLLLSTDCNLLTRLEQCSLNENEVKTAYYISVQLSEFRQAIIRNGTVNHGVIYNTDGTIDFKAFTNGDRINLSSLMTYINCRLQNPLSREKLKRTRDHIAADLKKLLNKDGLWKKSFDSFSVSKSDDFWMGVNGHDILSAICYVNPNIRKVFINEGKYSQNRDFEMALSAKYDYSCLKGTKLYVKLREAELIREI